MIPSLFYLSMHNMAAAIIALNACSQAIIFSFIYGYSREVVDGGTSNRIFTFFNQYILLRLSFPPIYVFFPGAMFNLNLIFYGSLSLIAAVNYTASICHKNQMTINANENEKVQWLPLGLQNSPFFSKAVLYLAPNLSYLFYALYAATLVASLATGAYLPVGCVLGTLLVEQCYHRGWFPTFLEQPYRLLRVSLLAAAVLGINHWLTMGIGLLNVGYTLINYILTYVRGTKSASCQFEMSKPAHELSFERSLKGFKPNNHASLKQLVEEVKPLEVRLTFDHFRAANLVRKKIGSENPEHPFEHYSILFNQLNFNSESFRASILAEMACHDKFHELPIETRREELKLPLNASKADLYIAYLKLEMTHMVERLNTPSVRSLNHDQIYTLNRQARALLHFLVEHPTDLALHESVLLSLALRTGSHCSRAYLDVFAELCDLYQVGYTMLTLRERSMLVAQSIRDKRFRTYYYEVLSKLSWYQAMCLDPLFYLSSDKNDYHTFERYALHFGGLYYLNNQSLQMRFPGLNELRVDWRNYCVLISFLGKPGLFSYHYDEIFMIKEVIVGKLTPIFEEWCNSFYQGAYEDWVLKEYSNDDLEDDFDDAPCFPDKFIILNSGLLCSNNVITLAKLMLLDLGIIELSEPLDLTLVDRLKRSSYDGLMTALKPRVPRIESKTAEEFRDSVIKAAPNMSGHNQPLANRDFQEAITVKTSPCF